MELLNDDVLLAVCGYLNMFDHISLFNTSQRLRKIVKDFYRNGRMLVTDDHAEHYEQQKEVVTDFWRCIIPNLRNLRLELKEEQFIRVLEGYKFPSLKKFSCLIKGHNLSISDVLKSILLNCHMQLEQLSLENFNLPNFVELQQLSFPQLTHFTYDAPIFASSGLMLQTCLEASAMNLQQLTLRNLLRCDLLLIKDMHFPALTNLTIALKRKRGEALPIDMLESWLSACGSNLRHLSIEGGIDEEAFFYLVSQLEFPKLTSLYLQFSTAATAFGLSEYKLKSQVEPKLKNIRKLTFVGMKAENFCAISCMKLPNLTYLDISLERENRLDTTQAMKSFLEANCSNMQHLSLDCVEWADIEALSHLQFPKLTHFTFNPPEANKRQRDGALKVLLSASCLKLQHLQLTLSDNSTVEALSELKFPKLRHFNYKMYPSFSQEMPDGALRTLLEPSCSSLEYLELHNLEWPDICELKSLPFSKLTQLKIATVPSPLSRQVEAFYTPHNFPQLRTIHLNGVPSIEGMGHVKKLRELSIIHCNVSPQHLEQVLTTLPLKKLRISTCNYGPESRDYLNSSSFHAAVGQCPTLKELDVDNFQRTNFVQQLFSGVRQVRKIPPACRKPDMRRCTLFDDEDY